ncbi:hypothetical protein [Bradyrhizobium sp. Ash2021]|nr:hypothetical protein [Bradyrhizobium sp. Ash2021]WMT73340.1 hypothetical protein NL528_36090 [Bradyrhizobium sp. Ash2021]
MTPARVAISSRALARPLGWEIELAMGRREMYRIWLKTKQDYERDLDGG